MATTHVILTDNYVRVALRADRPVTIVLKSDGNARLVYQDLQPDDDNLAYVVMSNLNDVLGFGTMSGDVWMRKDGAGESTITILDER